MIDRSAEAFLEQAIDTVGVAVAVTRLFGYQPNITTFSVDVRAKVAKVTPNSAAPPRDGSPANAPGALTQDDRTVILMAKHLRAERFPLPLRKGDKVTLKETGDVFDVSDVDPYTMAIAGAVTLTVTGVS